MLFDRTKEAEPIFFILVKIDTTKICYIAIEIFLPYVIGRILPFEYTPEMFTS